MSDIQTDFFLRDELKQFWTTDYQNIVCSNSGGRTSAFMSEKMRRDPYWQAKNILNIVANTGKEDEATLEFLDRQDKEFGLNLVWVEADVNPEHGEGTTFRQVTFETASRNGEPFEAVIKKYGIPNKMFPHCSRELKERPINAYAKSIFGNDYATAIGIRIDEMSRVKQWNPRKVYPLWKYETTVRDVRKFWNEQPFDLALKDYEGNCDLCWKKSKRKLLTLIKERPLAANWWIEMERLYANADISGQGVTANFHRMNETTLDLVELAKRPFIPVTDPYWRESTSCEMDDESPCHCGNID